MKSRLGSILTLAMVPLLVLAGLLCFFPHLAAAQGPVSWQQANAPPGASISAFAAHPADPDRLWAANWGDHYSGYTYLYRSDDGGRNWDLMGGGLPDNCAQYHVSVHSSGFVGALGCSNVYLSTDDGMTWQQRLQDKDVRQLAMTPLDAQVLYVLVYGEGVLRSDDGGATWKFAGAGLPSDGGALTLHPSDPHKAYFFYITYQAGTAHREWWQTDDGGASWQSLSTNGLPETSISCISSITVNPGTPSLVLAAACYEDTPALFLSSDGGATWNATPVFTASGPYAPSPVVAAGSPNIVYLTDYRFSSEVWNDALYRSDDSGQTWQFEADSLPCSLHAVDWKDASTLYGLDGTSITCVSHDTGSSWITTTIPTYLYSLAPHPEGGLVVGAEGNVYRSEDGLDIRATDGALPPLRSVTALAVHPITPTILYAGLGGNYYASAAWPNAQLVWRSGSGGRTWTQSHAGLPITGSVESLLVDPAQPRTVYAALNDTVYGQEPPSRVYRSTDAGDSWVRADTGLPADYIYDLVAAPGGGIIYTGSRYGVYTSSDHGESWTSIGPDIADFVPGYSGYSIVCTMAVSGTTLYAGVCGAEGTGYSAHSVGCNVYRTADGGQTWQAGNGWAEDAGASRLVLGSDRIQASWFKSYWSGGTRVTEQGGYWSGDGGENWAPLDLPGCGESLLGASADGRLFVNVKHGGLVGSDDGGETWTSRSSGLQGAGANITAMAAFSDTIYTGSFWGVLFRSSDRGEHWDVLAPGLGFCDTRVEQIAIHPADPERVYVGTTSLTGTALGVFRSTNGGDSWENVLSGTAEEIVLLPNDLDRVWVARRYYGLTYSEDGGDTWQTIENEYLPVYSAAVNPSNPDVILVGTTGIWLSDRGAYYCIFRSVDGGTSWDPVLGDVPACQSAVATSVEFNLHNPDIAYADGYRSEDGGRTWEVGRRAPWQLAFDPVDPSRAYGLTMDLVFDGLLQRSLDGGESWDTPGWPADGVDFFTAGWGADPPRLYALDVDTRGYLWWALDDRPYGAYLPLILK